MKPVTGNDLIALIPQKPPFVMISKLIEAVDNKCTTAFTIEADNVLCDNGTLNPSGLIENMAQTSAAMTGYRSFVDNTPPPSGYIGDIRDFTYTRLPKIGEEITTEVVVENQIFDVIMISGKVMLNGEEIASCKMKIFSRPS